MTKEIAYYRDMNRYCIIFDKNGTCAQFFTYRATMHKVNRDIIKISLGEKTREEALEELRNELVSSMKLGDTFVMSVDNLTPDFKKDWNEKDVFPLEEICDFDKWRDDEEYKSIMAKTEN